MNHTKNEYIETDFVILLFSLCLTLRSVASIFDWPKELLVCFLLFFALSLHIPPLSCTLSLHIPPLSCTLYTFLLFLALSLHIPPLSCTLCTFLLFLALSLHIPPLSCTLTFHIPPLTLTNGRTDWFCSATRLKRGNQRVKRVLKTNK